MNIIDALKYIKVKALRLFREFISFPFVIMFNWFSNAVSNRNVFSFYCLEYSSKGCDLTDAELQELVDFYLSMRKKIKDSPKKDMIGGLWTDIIENEYSHFVKSLVENDHKNLREILSNFGSNSSTRGISLFGDIPRSKLSKIDLINRFNQYHYYFSKLVRNPKISFPSNFGKIHGAHHKGLFYQVSTFRHNYYASRIRQLTKEKSKVVEIGAGYGAVPYQLFKNYNFQGSYIIFDLPEMLVLCAAFLKQALPNVDVHYNDINVCNSNEKNLIVLMPHYSFNELKPMSVDLVFNAHSLTEMDYSVTSFYLNHIVRITTRYFLSFNHEHRLSYKSNGKMKAHSCLMDENFLNILTTDMTQIYRFPEIIQNQPFCDTYYEYLFVRN